MGCGSSAKRAISPIELNKREDASEVVVPEEDNSCNTSKENNEQNGQEPINEKEAKYNTLQVQELQKHNEYRALHGSSPIKLNAELCKMAEAYAEKLIAEGRLEHASSDERRWNGSVGENLAAMNGHSLEPDQIGPVASKPWYDEIVDYDWSNPGFAKATGHFTQLVWIASTELGIGYAADNNRIIICGRYWPAGNVVGGFKDNVPKLL